MTDPSARTGQRMLRRPLDRHDRCHLSRRCGCRSLSRHAALLIQRRWRSTAAESISSNGISRATQTSSSGPLLTTKSIHQSSGATPIIPLRSTQHHWPGATLLHLCVDYDEIDIARWLIARGADVNVRAEVDEEGFGDHTGCVVSQPIRLRYDDVFARLLLDHGADPNVRTSLRKQLRGVDDESMHEYCDVTALAWGSRFHH